MVIRVLKFFSLQNKIDLSQSGIDDLKLIIKLILIVTSLIIVFAVPWLYGISKIINLIFKWMI